MALAHPVHDASIPALAQLLARARERVANNLLYGGDVTPREAWDYLSSHPGCLADVRTPPEWQAGVPDLANTQGKFLKLSWKIYPDYVLNPAFADEFAAASPDKNAPFFFLCRSGGRSLDAAVAMSANGYGYCFNISGGFESEQGWKAAKLPWKQG